MRWGRSLKMQPTPPFDAGPVIRYTVAMTTASNAQSLSRLDVVGASASFLCAAHCAAMPLLVPLLPVLGLEFLASHAFDLVFVAGAILLGGFAVARGLRHHRDRGVAVGFGLASLLLVLGVVVGHEGHAHELILVAGGLAMGWTHLRNLALLRRHRCAPSAAVLQASGAA
jgi:hypothetical protein